MAQRVVIPKGLVNPGETTIVEIPANYRNVSTVVARQLVKPLVKKGPNMEDWYYPDSQSSSEMTPPRAPPRPVSSQRKYMRKTHPRPSDRKDWAPDRYTFGGRDFDPDATPPLEPYVPEAPYSPELSYGQFNPNVAAGSTLADISYDEGSLYRDFRPKLSSSRRDRASSPGYSPPSMGRFQSTPTKVIKKSSVTKSFPGEFSQEDIEESYYEDDSTPISSGSGPSGSGSSGGYQAFSGVDESGCSGPCQRSSSGGGSYGSSGGYKGFSSGGGSRGSSGGYRTASSSGGSGGYKGYSTAETSSSAAVSGDEMSQMLSQLESQEQEQIMQDMSAYQEARRKLLFDASSLSTAADVSLNLLGSHTV